MINRRKTREVSVGNVKIGGDNPIAIQSMNNTKTFDIKATLKQINEFADVGCNITRVAVNNSEAAEALKEICKKSPIPVVADIHFDYKLALKAIENGVSKLRINPGNIGSDDKVRQVVNKAKEKNISIRIGVNAGSLEKDLLKKYGSPTPEAIVESAMHHIKILESLEFHNIIISLKSSDVLKTVESYKLLAQKVDYPFHVGITEAGTEFSGAVRSSVGIGILFYLGLGDTVRVSLSADPIKEIRTAYLIQESLGLRNDIVRVISCPTCGRTEIPVEDLAKEIEEKVSVFHKNIHVAVMGCVVNGPGEAREADYGLAGGKGEGIIFKKGEIVGKYPENELVDRLIEIIEKEESVL